MSMFADLSWNLAVLVGVSLAIYIFTVAFGWVVKELVTRVIKQDINNSVLYTGYYAALPFGLAAIVLGFLSGLSFEPAASALITGIVSLISGAAFVVFTKDIRTLLPVGIVVVVFALNLLSGATLGANKRDDSLAITEDDLAGELLRNSRIEFRINNYRENLGLPKLQVPVITFEAEPIKPQTKP